MQHPSHYFEPVKRLFDNSSTSLEQMHNVLIRTKCPKELIEPIINGCIKDEIQNQIPRDGMQLNELHDWLKEKINDITDNYIEKTLKHMLSKSMVHINDGAIFNLTISMPNIPINLL